MTKTNDFIKAKADKKLGEVKITWTASYFEGQVQDKSATKEIASMPSRETLLGRLVGSMQSPLSSFARFLDAAAKKLDEEGKDNLGSVEVKKEAKVEEVKEETPKEEVQVEGEKKEEEKVETSQEEVKEEA